MRILINHDEDIANFVVSHMTRSDKKIDTDKYRATGIIDNDGKLVAGVVYRDYLPQYGQITMHCYSLKKNWLTKNIMIFLLGYPFIACNCRIIILPVKSSNVSLCEQLYKFGFEGNIVKDIYGDGEDQIIFTLKKENLKNIRILKKLMKMEV